MTETDHRSQSPKAPAPGLERWLRFLLSGLGLALLLLAGLEFGRIAWGTGVWVVQFSFKWALAFGLFAVFAALVGGALLVIAWQPTRLERLNKTALGLRARLGWGRWLLAAGVILLPGIFLIYTPWGDIFSGPFLRLLLYIGTAIAAGFLLTRGEARIVGWTQLAAGFVLTASALVLTDALITVRTYPFSLSWSEGNRMWDYSIFYASHLYNFPIGEEIFAFIDPGRQTLWGLPFALPFQSIVLTRLWSAFLFTIPYAILGWVAFRRGRGSWAPWLLAGLWVMIFLSQGPIYTPLVLSAILVAVAFHIRWLWVSLLLVLLASLYAQLSRFTWMFAPAMWAGMLALGSSATQNDKNPRRDWARAIALMAVGVLGGYLVPNLFEATPQASADDVYTFSGISDFIGRQALLWYRLLPNATNDLGILFGLLLAAGPLVILLVYLAAIRRWQLNWVQKLAVVLPLVAFCLVGLVISIKIGGGNNLHNMDMFLIGLVFAAVLAWTAGGRRFITQLDNQSQLSCLVVILLVALPGLLPLWDAKPLALPPGEVSQASLETIQTQVGAAAATGEVLMMDQRQLLTFGQIQNLPLVDEYEKKYLMDQALTADAVYFEGFYSDLAEGRFTLIVSHPIKVDLQGSERNFGEENDAWDYWVGRALLCYYEPILTMKEDKIQLLVPRPAPVGECP